MNSSKKPAVPASPRPASSPSSSRTLSSKTQETFKESTKRWDSIASQFNLPLSSELTALPPAVLPTFPTVKQLLEKKALEPSSKPSGLYEELLQSRPEAMFVDTLDHPQKYEGGVPDLLEELTRTRRAPTEEERALLDRAVLDFMTKPREKPPAPKPVPRAVLEEPIEPPEAPQAEEAPGGGEMKPFWWL